MGIEGLIVEVEADLGVGLPTFTIVGLPDAAVRESRERVLAALRNCGFEFPARKITINLAPAHVRKEGARFDLPIAVALLLASGQIPRGDAFEEGIFVGELALDGTVRGVRGVLAVLVAARREGLRTVWLPLENAAEARAIPDVSIAPIRSLGVLRGDGEGDRAEDVAGDRSAPAFATHRFGGAAPALPAPPPDLAHVRGQGLARRALEIAAAGGHNLLLTGPPGAGKTLLARTLPGILPPLRIEEAIEVTTIHSVAGRVPPGAGLIKHPPFRAPHHTISPAGLIGGGRGPQPGEVSLAHRGVLFLDEMPEFPRHALEALRQPLEEGAVTIARVGSAVTLPAQFALVGAMNPCPCGYAGDPNRGCRCTPESMARYRARLSGPILDRIDLILDVPALPASDLFVAAGGEPSSAVRDRVLRARILMMGRRAESAVNARVAAADLEPLESWEADARRLLERAVDAFGLSARGVLRVRRVARTIADLAGSEGIAARHAAEALQYRLKPGSSGENRVDFGVRTR